MRERKALDKVQKCLKEKVKYRKECFLLKHYRPTFKNSVSAFAGQNVQFLKDNYFSCTFFSITNDVCNGKIYTGKN